MSAGPTRIGEWTTSLAWALVRWPEGWILLGPAVYLAAAVSPPILGATGHPEAQRLAMLVFRGFCHQLPHRSLFLLGSQMAICSRCAALSGGVVLGALLAGRMCAWIPTARWIRPTLWWVTLAAVPMALDGFTQLFGFRESTNTLRVATGLLLGGMVSAWAVPIVREALDLQRPRREGHSS